MENWRTPRGQMACAPNTLEAATSRLLYSWPAEVSILLSRRMPLSSKKQRAPTVLCYRM